MSQPSTCVATLRQRRSRWRGPRRARRRAPPTARRAARPPSDVTAPARRTRLVASPIAHRRVPAAPVAHERDLEAKLDAALARARSPATSSPRRRTSAAVPPWSLTMKLACFSLTDAPPMRAPLRPELVDEPTRGVSSGRVAEEAPGRRHPSGWWAWRQRRISSSRAAMTSGSAGVERERGPGDDLGRALRRVLQHALAVAQAQLVARHRRLGAVRAEHARLDEHVAHLRLVGAGVGPHGAAHGARDGQPELEARQARLLGHRRRLGHGQARSRR